MHVVGDLSCVVCSLPCAETNLSSARIWDRRESDDLRPRRLDICPFYGQEVQAIHKQALGPKHKDRADRARAVLSYFGAAPVVQQAETKLVQLVAQQKAQAAKAASTSQAAQSSQAP